MAQITLRNYLQEAEDAIRDDRINDAFTHCRIILTLFPESLEAQRLLGEAHLAQGQLEEAQQSFDWILTNDPENVVAYCNRALICERSLDYDTALDCYQQAYELSHGNSQIRQEFNRLSAEMGPQGFMFSRAGLARLYMRGDLLTQAIQEWETVLAVNPERLDARMGLLETCWREAHYERVEQLAAQILQDVPGCLKALFLLAYVTSSKNIQQTQELLKRAEALDPDLLMAQELFSDIMSRQPAEPFLHLLKKAPVTVETALLEAAATVVPGREEASAQPTYTSTAAMPAEAFAGWNSIGTGNIESWSNESTLMKDTQEERQAMEYSPVSPWPVAAANPVVDVWSALEGQQGVGSLQALQNISAQLQSSTSDKNPLNYDQSVERLETSSQPKGQSLETWMSDFSLNMMAEDKQKEVEAPSWENPGLYDDVENTNPWSIMPSSTDNSGIWSSTSKEGAMPSPPAWLNMLTQSEIRQLSDEEEPAPFSVEEPVIAAPAPVQQPPAAPAPVQQPPAAPAPVQRTSEEEPASTLKAGIDDDEEASSFGPEWLKSLGAASIEDGSSPAEASSVLSYSSVDALEAEVWQTTPGSQVYEQESVTYEAPADDPQLQPFSEEVADSVGSVEYDVLTTLEELEAGLRSQGFTPLEPNTLKTIAKTPEAASSAIPKTPELTLSQEEEAYQHESLPSALAEVGRFVQEPVNASSMVTSFIASAQSASTTPIEEPSWLASLSAMPSPSSTAERQQEMFARQGQEGQMYSTLPPVQQSLTESYTSPYETSSLSSRQKEALLAAQAYAARPDQPLPDMPSWFQEQEPAREEERADNSLSDSDPAQPAWAQTNSPQVVNGQAPTPVTRPVTRVLARQSSSGANNDLLLNSELETTMKRPAVRLQSMEEQSYSSGQKDRVPLAGRSRMAEPIYSGGNPQSDVSYQERLLKGYQHQLVGDYDEAMQEYRIIIRHSPELLGEIVSNVRALLKLAPKYLTGYRVLGDAYMRQGEYLQAMESYNKALTMAKRAKS